MEKWNCTTNDLAIRYLCESFMSSERAAMVKEYIVVKKR